MKTRDHVLLFINGKPHTVRGEEAGMMLSDYLRYQLQLTGTKVVCAEGDCGACTVLRQTSLPGSATPIFEPINSCILTVAQMDSAHLLTIEAMGEGWPEGLSPVQSAMVSCHGSQCGFCTPGFVMALSGLVDKRVAAGAATNALQNQEVKNALTGNLCRCTGYQPIIEAARAIPLAQCPPLAQRFVTADSTRARKKGRAVPVEVKSPTFHFYAPLTAKAAARFLSQHSEGRVIGAGTDLGVLVNKGKLTYRALVSLHLIPELNEVRERTSKGKKGAPGPRRLWIGGNVTIADLRRATESSIPELARFLDLFASPQIKHAATLAGNVANASPIGDTLPFLLVAGATLHLTGPKGEREIPIEKFFLDYRKTARKRDEIITAIEIDIPEEGEELWLTKVSQRKDLDISAVSAAFRVRWADRPAKKIADIRVGLGGVAGVPLRLKRTEGKLAQRALDSGAVAAAVETLQSEITPLSDLRGSAAYRRVVAENLLTRFLESRT